MYCSKCGYEMPEGSQFCPKCGSSASDDRTNSTSESEQVAVRQDLVRSVQPSDLAESAGRESTRKKGKGRLIVVLALVITVAAVSAGGVWYVMSQQHAAEIENLLAEREQQDRAAVDEQTPESTESSSSQTDAPSRQSADDDSDTPSPYQKWVGAWAGALAETHIDLTASHCYGAEAEPLLLTIQDITAAGRVTVDATVLWHGHESVGLSGDATSVAGDEVLNLTDLVGTFSESGFTVSSDLGNGSQIELDIRPASGASEKLRVEVKSTYADGMPVVDEFELMRAQS